MHGALSVRTESQGAVSPDLWLESRSRELIRKVMILLVILIMTTIMNNIQ